MFSAGGRGSSGLRQFSKPSFPPGDTGQMAHRAVLQEGDTELREPNLLSRAVAVLALRSRWNLGVCLPLGGCSRKDALEHGGLCN